MLEDKRKELFRYHSRGITQNSTLFVALAVGMFAILSILAERPLSSAWWLLAWAYLLIPIPGGLFLIRKLKISVMRSYDYSDVLELDKEETARYGPPRWFDRRLREEGFWRVLGSVWASVSWLVWWAVYLLAA